MRVTITEASEFLKYPKSWFYQTLHKLGFKEVKTFVDIPEVAELIRFAFKAGSYELIPYELLVNKKFLKIVQQNKIVDLGDYIHSVDDMIDVIVALKVSKPQMAIFNLLSYASRKIRTDVVWRKQFKDIIFMRFVKLYVKGKVDFNLFVDTEDRMLSDLEVDLIAGFKKYALDNWLSNNK